MIHELVEYMFAFALIVSGLRVHSGVVFTLILLIPGGALLVLNFVSAGPLGAAHYLSRRAHRLLDYAICAILAVSPAVTLHRSGIGGVLAAELIAFVELVVVHATRYDSTFRLFRARSREIVIDTAGTSIKTRPIGDLAARLARASAHDVGYLAAIVRSSWRSRPRKDSTNSRSQSGGGR